MASRPDSPPANPSSGELERLHREFAERERVLRAELETLRASAESDDRFRAMADSAPVFIWTSDTDNHCDWFNATWLAFTGRTLAQTVGEGWYDDIHPDDLANVIAADAKAFVGREPLEVEYRLRRHDGKYHWVQDVGAPRYAPDGRFLGYIGTSLDIHDRREAADERMRQEERARQATKMEAIGRLAGGLAHDLNNQLQAVLGFLTFLERDPGITAQGLRDVAEIDKATERMRSLVAQLLAFSRQQVLSPETLDINTAVVDAQALLQRLVGPTIDMQLELEGGQHWIRVDRTQLLQVLMNLTINARDALPKGGKVVFRTRAVEKAGGQSDATGGVIPPGRYVQLQVIDTGSGISNEDLSRIFEPFFTTKPAGKGTGLGLATVHGIVAQSQGHITVDSKPGEGSTFTVLLPVAEPELRTERRNNTRGIAGQSGAWVLVVEDEDVVRRVVVRTLEEAGYHTVQARHGGEALEVLNSTSKDIALILTDLIMPVMNGIELTSQLTDSGFQVPVVWMSGHPLETIPEAQLGAEVLPFMAKPINPAQLLDVVGRLTSPK
jgi:PAS domain S-box-containing protein